MPELMNGAMSEHAQRLNLGVQVTLYEVDITPLGGPLMRYTAMNADGTALGEVRFGGQLYEPFPIVAEGFAWSSGTAPAQPTVSIANHDHALTNLILEYHNLLGAKFTRIVTFGRFLDGQPDADGDAHLPPDVYRFERKTLHNDIMIQWDLASWIDQQGVMLPKRMVVRDYCSLRYRDGRSGSFDYSKATCPYTGSDMFTVENASTAHIPIDVCSHTLKGCRLRFQDADLPFGGFPGVVKFRV